MKRLYLRYKKKCTLEHESPGPNWQRILRQRQQKQVFQKAMCHIRPNREQGDSEKPYEREHSISLWTTHRMMILSGDQDSSGVQLPRIFTIIQTLDWRLHGPDFPPKSIHTDKIEHRMVCFLFPTSTEGTAMCKSYPLQITEARVAAGEDKSRTSHIQHLARQRKKVVYVSKKAKKK